MSEFVPVRAERIRSGKETTDLMVISLDGTGRVWKRRYAGNLALTFDAFELGLLDALKHEELPAANSISLDVERLEGFRFTLVPQTRQP